MVFDETRLCLFSRFISLFVKIELFTLQIYKLL